ncbi:cadmium-translocating P-type ATPase [Deinococcus koreensis]|uniref:Cadmium-translocating P-type ATPase n=2 Tax=Deinococcus koreensis TaxID=2054903 RepID=A0A2K3UTT0_9DEIO|nr:cadmium-translocating P-type ATPase [Deinococcus koreensis]
MDCASCVQKVERMVERLPGTAAVKTSFTRQTLHLELDEAQTPRQTLERHLRSLGYVPTLQAGTAAPFPQAPAQQDHAQPSHAGHDHAGHDHPAPSADPQGDHAGHVHAALPAGQPWYASGQGRLVITSGVLLAMAWLFGRVEPTLSGPAYVAATALGVWPLMRRAVASARLGDPFSINMLVSLAALGALMIGQAAEGAVVVFLFAVGELLEGVAAGRARAGVQALSALTPKTALLLEDGTTREVPAGELRVGQTVQVRPGARVPADGTITAGTSSLDDSPVTGESVPVVKPPGARVYAGSINLDGVLSVQVDRSASDNTIARIIQLVEEAEGSRAATARFIDRFSRVYTPGVVAVSALVALLPPLLTGAEWHPWLYRGLTLLLIGCPCALVLSVPAAVTSAISAGARRGLLIKGGAALEAIGSVKTVAFDKTGTLTTGRPRLTDLSGLGLDRLDALRLAAGVEAGSDHPLARAVTRAASDAGLRIPAAEGALALPGQGVRATVEGRALWVSSPQHAATMVALPEGLLATLTSLEGQGKTAVILHGDGQALGLLAMRDEPRPDAAQTLARLGRLGIRTVMLTGDNARTAQAVAAELSPSDSSRPAPGLDVHAGLLPEDKLRAITALRAGGGVAMVGDGINDAPALAAATVGVAMGGGTDVALETADAALLRGRMGDVADLVQLSRDTMTNIRWNIALALGLKAVFLITTLLGTTTLWMAILADTGATALVTANALRLLGWRGHDRAPLARRNRRPEAVSR